LIEALYYRANICKKANGFDGIRGIAKVALKAINGIIDSITKTVGIFYAVLLF
jgi:hypothetical protein